MTLLRRLGVEVDFPEAQTCCGQPMINTGYLDEAVPPLRSFVKAFDGYDADRHAERVVRRVGAAPARDRGRSAGPVTPAWWRPSSGPAPRTYELTEFLVDVLGVTDVGAYFPHRVTYHPTCHSLRMLGVGDRPTRLLRAVRGLDLVELPRAEECCGFGGTFAVKNADTSVAMVSDKARHVRETGAEVLVAGDSSCLMNIGGALTRQRAGVRVMHLAEVLASTEGSSMTGTFVGMPTVPGRRPGGARGHPAAPQPGPRDRAPSATSGRRSSPRSTTGRSCGSRAPRSRTPRCPRSTSTWSLLEERLTAAGRDGALGPRRRGGLRDRGRGRPKRTASTRS